MRSHWPPLPGQKIVQSVHYRQPLSEEAHIGDPVVDL